MPKIGDALKKAVETRPEDVEDKTRARPSSPLMNQNRRRIYQQLCTNPCSSTGQISHGLQLSRSTVSWHLEQLVESGYVEAFIFGKNKHFCPAGLISRRSMVVFSLLNRPTGQRIFRAILEEPGLDPAGVRDKSGTSASNVSETLKKMLELGLVKGIRDGRHVRYYPTEGHIEILKEDLASQKEFLRKLLKRMNDEHLRPEVDELKGGGVVIAFKVPGQMARIQIPYHPLESLVLKE